MCQKAVVNAGGITSPGSSQINLVAWASQLKGDSANYRQELIPIPWSPCPMLLRKHHRILNNHLMSHKKISTLQIFMPHFK